MLSKKKLKVSSSNMIIIRCRKSKTIKLPNVITVCHRDRSFTHDIKPMDIDSCCFTSITTVMKFGMCNTEITIRQRRQKRTRWRQRHSSQSVGRQKPYRRGAHESDMRWVVTGHGAESVQCVYVARSHRNRSERRPPYAVMRDVWCVR